MPQGPQPFKEYRHKTIGIVKVGRCSENNSVGLHQLRIKRFEIIVKFAQIVVRTKMGTGPAGRIG
jgi:hypothetical protein